MAINDTDLNLPMGECPITLQDVGILLGLPIDGAPVICPVSPAAGMSWATIIYAIFRHLRLNNRFNDSRIQLIWFK